MKLINTYYVSTISVYTEDQFTQSLEIWLMDKFKNCIISGTDGKPVDLKKVIENHIEYLMKKHGIKGKVVSKIDNNIEKMRSFVFQINREGGFDWSRVFVTLDEVDQVLGHDDIREIEMDTLKRMKSLGK